MQFDQDTIKELSVYAVQQFVSNKVPLDVSIAEKAKSLKLNEDQVKRVVESTNVIAFLKLRDGAEDKTFEFQVASFPGVMDAILGNFQDRAYVDVTGPECSTLDKVAFSVTSEIPEDQRHQTLFKVAAHLKADLEKVAQEHYNCVSDLERAIPVLVKQAHWQERLEFAAKEDFDRIMTAFGKSGFEKAASLNDMVFVGRELEVATAVVSLIKQAAELQTKRSELEDLEKKAGFALGKLLGMGKSVVGGASAFAKDPVKGLASAATYVPTAAASGTFKAARAIVAKKIPDPTNAAKHTYKLRNRIGLGAVATVGISAASYTPPVNQRTGRSNDVWSNIYE
jgi:hypothetical protein